MIKNLWKVTNFYCNCRHTTPQKMQFVDGPSSLFYACPKYYPENREPGEPSCMMRMNLIDAEGVLEEFSKIIEEDEANNVIRDYRGFEFDYKTVHAKVISYSYDSGAEIIIDNKKAMRWIKK